MRRSAGCMRNAFRKVLNGSQLDGETEGRRRFSFARI
jgi:hypothetical protein